MKGSVARLARRIQPFRELGKDGLGGFELAARYDPLDVAKTLVLARRGDKARSKTVGLTWYANPFAKLMVNWACFRGLNTPFDPIGEKTAEGAVVTRLHLDF